MGSVALLLLTLPVQLVVAVLVRLESPGPVLCREERIGLHGAPFLLLRFRSTRMDRQGGGQGRELGWAGAAGARVTRTGRWLRLLGLDELPQLLNVLRGDMSLIGPHPERPGVAAMLAAQVPHYALRHAVKPGITGWAQVNRPYGASMVDARERLGHDLHYVQHQGWRLDLRILLATLRLVLGGAARAPDAE